MTKEEIITKLDAMGIEYDGRLGADRLRELLPVERPGVSCVVQRDFWDADGIRHRAGSVMTVSVEDAMDGVETGALKRFRAE